MCISEDALYNYPMQGWRWKLQNWVRKILRAMFFCMGLHSVEVYGKQVNKGQFLIENILKSIKINV